MVNAGSAVIWVGARAPIHPNDVRSLSEVDIVEKLRSTSPKVHQSEGPACKKCEVDIIERLPFWFAMIRFLHVTIHFLHTTCS